MDRMLNITRNNLALPSPPPSENGESCFTWHEMLHCGRGLSKPTSFCHQSSGFSWNRECRSGNLPWFVGRTMLVTLLASSSMAHWKHRNMRTVGAQLWNGISITWDFLIDSPRCNISWEDVLTPTQVPRDSMRMWEMNISKGGAVTQQLPYNKDDT